MVAHAPQSLEELWAETRIESARTSPYGLEDENGRASMDELHRTRGANTSKVEQLVGKWVRLAKGIPTENAVSKIQLELHSLIGKIRCISEASSGAAANLPHNECTQQGEHFKSSGC